MPDSLGPTMYSNRALIDQQRLQQKLGTIVRAKERKMVNVGSQIPFNLHNQVLPPEVNHTQSRPASGTPEYFTDTDEYAPGMYYQHPYRSPHARFTTSPSPEPYDYLSHPSRPRSPDGDSNSKTILNVRLVGFVDRRGRTMRRKEADVDADVASDSTPTAATFQRISQDTEPPAAAISPDKARLLESGAISLSWGD
ncbi:hypothetical protein LshimejAT787_0112700 [Lyophyllum shimeji]|uniref:Uncharacterized protein n=1 Tax=Lyophyllum shimeji TaxID=47721 RepID=A0A9P3PEG8_LYOSH|nr:hypothetical protein LshimejAT787_0112700 [Lyophyllum shimeji]